MSELSRRTFLAASAATAAVGTTVGSALTASAAVVASPPGDVVGKVTVGYQGWFACAGVGAR